MGKLKRRRIYDMNSGYHGYSMSKNAFWAYENGERPLSRWAKAEILKEIAKIDTHKAELLKKVCLPVLKDNFLEYTAWHHTSSKCNKTDFYALDTDYIKSLTEEDILSLSKKKPKKKVEKSMRFKGDIHYLVWSKTRGGFTKVTRCLLEDVNIERRGCYYYISNDQGEQILRKKTDSNGTVVVVKSEMI